jgi:phosphoenolpyruvate phosphomutase / 2-hydroxyethylphosphonate cytidylyltransferase
MSENFKHTKKQKIEKFSKMKTDIVYVAMSADLIHVGHIYLIQAAAKYGEVVVGLLSNEAIKSYKREPIITWEERYRVIKEMKSVAMVVPQRTHDYTDNLLLLRPSYVVHGSDWKTGVQSKVRQKVINVLAEWGGELIEPDYTNGISTTDIINRCNKQKI